jgi:hypothetical protein
MLRLLSYGCLFAGCAATRPISDVVLGGGRRISRSRTFQRRPARHRRRRSGRSRRQRNAPLRREEAGRSGLRDRLRQGQERRREQQYRLYVSMQRQRNQVSSVRLYPVQLPEQRIDGVTFQPSTKLLRIEE